jgi:hypothetical protein
VLDPVGPLYLLLLPWIVEVYPACILLKGLEKRRRKTSCFHHK